MEKQFEFLMKMFEDGFDVKDGMSALFSHFIDIHINEDDRIILEYGKLLASEGISKGDIKK